MQKFEKDYASMIRKILASGEERKTRNGVTKSLFGMSLEVPLGSFPLIQGRKMHLKGILGEFAALIRQPKTVADFKAWGCNYWDTWADADGALRVDYGNAWFDFDGYDQIAELKRCLREDPMNRRMIVSSWRPNRIADLSLPCCHYGYQFYVREGKYLDMIWTQRSVDMMIGLPSDIILAAIWVITLANEFGLAPGKLKLDLGDCHVYEEHWEQAEEYCHAVAFYSFDPVYYLLQMTTGADFCSFEPHMLAIIEDYQYGPKLDLLLKE